VRHFDFTWLRAVAPGSGTTPHCDIVYMGRGTKQLFTAWVPFGDITLDIGGLMVLESSHRQQDRLRRYLERDVDEYCENLPRGQEVADGKRGWEFDGTLAKDPRSLRQKLGGRWLTAPEFRMGDVVVFGMFLVHASLDNQSDRIRLSTDSRYQLASEPADERWVGPNPVGHSRAGKRGRVC
jgi:ectoine hydroxylase-related dioxygenase (phytanoyl-CoA dioxygenase family)